MSATQKSLSALLETHVEFELKQWQGKTLNRRLKEEVQAFWDWAEGMTLDQFSTPKTITLIIQHVALEVPLPKDVPEIFGTIAKHLVRLPVNRETSVADIVNAELFDDGVELLVDLKQLRQEAIHQAVHSPVYATLVSEILYNGIRDYLGSENLFTQKVPGMGKLMSKGADVLSKRIPNLEEKLRGYISRNMQKTVKQSESFLQQALSEKRIRQLAAEIWELIHRTPVSVSEVLDDDEVDAIVAYVFEIWVQLRKTDYIAELIAEAIQKFFAEYGEMQLARLLETAGINRKLIENAVMIAGPQVVKVLEESGYIEATIRRRLEPFYASKEAVAALG